MRHTAYLLPAIASFGLLLTPLAQAQLPARDLIVELRQVDDGGGYTASTQPSAAPVAPQQVHVRNGEAATLSMGQNMPIRWVQSVGGQSSQRTSGAGSASSSGGGVSYGMVWMQSGQSLRVQPRWPGGKQAVAVQIDLQAASVAAPTGNAELPSQERSQLSTTVSAPLGQWVTVAASGGQAVAGSYSSEAAVEARRLVQIRVSAR
ncbi:type II and III secretion system protein [Rhodoferax sp. OV413]|uniref:hypothetical protein n=1 Tax=Rhodoferax sp. OV413 TaxID=1855285 RepID=UPI00089167B4|nr:hypothetical protein [Rhodoferax sp. OV413]SDO31338.1 type II and III secretion system protein [Rhodoferax sp. OV413]